MAKAKRPPKSEQEVLPIGELFIDQLAKESDRGCVLVAAAMLDEALEFLLRCNMSKEDALVKVCVDPLFVGLGPLKSFWAKIQLTRALGHIDQWMYDDLERIRNLRNFFAHTYSDADFANPRVVAITERLVGADKAVRSMSKRPQLGKIVPDRLIRDTRIQDRPIVKKERMRFTLAASYIGGRIHRKCVPQQHV